MSAGLEHGQRIRKLRLLLDMDGAQMGSALGITREWLSKLENGRAQPSELILIKLSELEQRIKHTSHDPVVALNEDEAPYRSDPIAPTAELLRAHLEAAIRAADDDPRVLAYIWGQLKIHLDPSQIEKLKSQ